VAGDFNNPPRGVLYRRMSVQLSDSFRAAGGGFGYTFRSDFPAMRIDYIWCAPGVRVVRCRTVRSRASDHLPVIADIRLPR
jgi:endonuclease/exonuclease/phosphatase (EEP) superfamily protein YafD